MDSFRTACPAKVNLYLRVLGKRPDGYHELVTLMQPLGLEDELVLHRTAGSGLHLRCDDPRLPVDETNLVWRAARLFQEQTGNRFGLEMHLTKRIPVGAGLGGGSSDAAGVLLGLNEMQGGKVPLEDLTRWALRLGADVPFFLGGRPAVARGIGERLEAAPALPPIWYVLIFPGWSVSTRWAYQRLDLGLTRPPKNIKIPRFLDGLQDVVELLHNDLESVTACAHPWVSRAKRRLQEVGASGVLMSGSGPTVFGIFADEQSARRAAASLPREGGERVWCSPGKG
jgi:4-diphosphocytidyl-2-C-methyl-D-erythritol kinase